MARRRPFLSSHLKGDEIGNSGTCPRPKFESCTRRPSGQEAHLAKLIQEGVPTKADISLTRASLQLVVEAHFCAELSQPGRKLTAVPVEGNQVLVRRHDFRVRAAIFDHTLQGALSPSRTLLEYMKLQRHPATPTGNQHEDLYSLFF